MSAITKSLLKAILLLALAGTIFVVHGYALIWLTDNALPHGPRALSRLAMLGHALAGAVVVAVPLALLAIRVYQKPLVATLLAVLPAAIWRATYISDRQHAFVAITVAVEVLALIAIPAVGTWYAARRKLHSNNSFKPNPLRCSVE